MKSSYDNFIGMYRDVYPEGYCSHMIEEFNRLEKINLGSNRIEAENALHNFKSDYHIYLNLRYHNLNHFNNVGSCNVFYDGLQKCFNDYSLKYSILRDGSNVLSTTTMKAQKTLPGEGYHVWHCEQGNTTPDRVLVYMLYLNSLNNDEGGETEFLYQRKRIRPEENLMLIWPAGFTHAHRGNTVLGENNKYIITGWFTLE